MSLSSGVYMLKLVHQQHCISGIRNPVYLLCVFRDEHLLLEYFVDYYRSLGVTHIIMIDNLSEDRGPEYLKSLKNINLLLYRTEDSYRDAAFGTAWINQLLQEHCINQYCFTVDVDELFVFDSRRYRDLHDLVDEMESSGSNAVPATLLDMYPRKVNDNYQQGTAFLTHSPFFDDLNETYYEVWHELYETSVFRVGGVRKRKFGVTACMQKFPLFKYDFSPLGVAPGYHVFQHNGEVLFQSDKIKLHRDPGVLLHFKFIKPQLAEFVEQRINRNEDWDDSAEYRAYREALGGKDNVLEFFDEKFSRKFENIESLGKFLRSPE
jgi:hypothetical protein